jgi:lysophospholipase L1-like esterase
LEKQLLPKQAKGFSTWRPVLGWGPAKAGSYSAVKHAPSGETVYDVTYTIDDHLLRKTISAQSGPLFAFFGDSFTFGEGLQDSETMPQAFADLTDRKFQVLNLGFPGYGPQQFYGALQNGLFDTTLGPNPRLFIYLTSVWHAERAACKPNFMARAARYAPVNGELVYQGDCTAGWRRNLKELLGNFSAFRNFIEPMNIAVAHDDIKLYLTMLEKTVQLAKQKYNVPILILYIPAGEAYVRHTGFTEDQIITRLRAAGAEVLEVSLDESKYPPGALKIAGDGHPSALGQEERAKMLVSYLKQTRPELSQNEPQL